MYFPVNYHFPFSTLWLTWNFVVFIVFENFNLVFVCWNSPVQSYFFAFNLVIIIWYFFRHTPSTERSYIHFYPLFYVHGHISHFYKDILFLLRVCIFHIHIFFFLAQTSPFFVGFVSFLLGFSVSVATFIPFSSSGLPVHEYHLFCDVL